MQRLQQLLPTRSAIFTKLGSLLALTAIVLPSSPAHSAVQDYRLFKSAGYQQTSNAQPSIPSGFGGEVDVLFANASDVTAAQVTSPSPLSPMTLNPAGIGGFNFGHGYSSLSALDTDFPNSATYQYAINGGTLGSETGSLSTPSTDLFASQVPFFTGTIYSQLQGMNPAVPFQFSFNGYTAPDGINAPLTFFGISRISDGQPAFDPSLSIGQTSVVMPGGTLQPATTYDVGLVYSCRIGTANAGFNGAPSEVAYDLRTDLIFTTGVVPEPSSFAMLALGSAGLIACYLRRTRKQV